MNGYSLVYDVRLPTCVFIIGNINFETNSFGTLIKEN